MELKLVDGRYAVSGGGLGTVSGAEEKAQRIMMKLCARRGNFLPLPDYGSRLYLLSRIRPSEREAAARQYIAEALSGEDAEIRTLSLGETEDGRLQLRLGLSCGGDELSLNATI